MFTMKRTKISTNGRETDKYAFFIFQNKVTNELKFGAMSDTK